MSETHWVDDLANRPPNVGQNLATLEPGRFLITENVAHLS